MLNETKDEKQEVTLFELLSIVSFLDKYLNMSKACEKELFLTYYEAVKIAKTNGN